MSFNPQEFISNLTGLGARPNLFNIQLQFPTLVGLGTLAGQKFSVMAKAGTLPGADIGTIRTNYMGREIKFPGDRTIGDYTLQVINDETFSIRDALVQWQNLLNSMSGNIRNLAIQSTDDYSTDIYINQFGKTDDVIPIKTIVLVGAFPSNIGGIELSWDQKDSFEEFSATFQYQFWTDETGQSTS